MDLFFIKTIYYIQSLISFFFNRFLISNSNLFLCNAPRLINETNMKDLIYSSLETFFL